MILTKQIMATIPAMVEQGMNTAAIAEALGCKPSTLKVRCSQQGISLSVHGCRKPRMRLSPETMDYFHRLAKRSGTNKWLLISELLTIIARDDLYKAVVDVEQPAIKEAA